MTLQRGEGGWSFGDRYLAADSCAQTWILRDPGFFIFCTSRLGVAAPKQKTVKDITSRLPFSQSPSSWSCSSHKAKAGSSALVSIVLIPLPEPGNQWSSARQTRRRYGSSAKFSVPDLGPGTPGLGGGCTDRGLAGLLSFPVGASPSSIASRNLPPPRRYSLDKNNIPVQVHTPDLQGKPRRQRRRPIPPSPRTSTTTPNESRVKQNHEKPTNRPGSLPPSRTDDTSPTRAPPSPPGGNDIRDTTTSLQTTLLLLNTHPPRRRQLPPHPNGHRIPRASGSSACTGAAGDCNTTTTTAAGPPPERLDNHPDSESL